MVRYEVDSVFWVRDRRVDVVNVAVGFGIEVIS